MQEPFEALKMLLVCNKLSMQVCKYSMPGWPGPGVCMCHVPHYSFDDDLFLCIDWMELMEFLCHVGHFETNKERKERGTHTDIYYIIYWI